MPRLRSTSRPGFLLLEVLLGLVIFGIFVGSSLFTVIRGRDSVIRSGDTTRGIGGAMQAIEAVRAMRDESYALVSAGTASNPHGLRIDPTLLKWRFFGASSTLSSVFTSITNVTALLGGATDPPRIQIDTTSSWDRPNLGGAGQVTLTAEITDWRQRTGPGNWSSPVKVYEIQPENNVNKTVGLNRIGLYGHYAYVTSNGQDSGGSAKGKQLYVIDIDDENNPQIVYPQNGDNDALDDGIPSNQSHSVSDIDINRQALFILVKDDSGNARINIYSLVDPENPEFKDSISLPDAESIATNANSPTSAAGLYLFVGTDENSGEFRSYSINTTTLQATLSSTINTSNSPCLPGGTGIYSISVFGNYAFLGAYVFELIAVNIYNPASPQFPNSDCFFDLSNDNNLPVSMNTTGTSALLVDQGGNVITYNVKNGPIPPWSGGEWPIATSIPAPTPPANGDQDPALCYIFTGNSSNPQQVRVHDSRSPSLAQVGSYTTPVVGGANDTVRGVKYDPVRDRLYLAGNKLFTILRPNGAGTCL